MPCPLCCASCAQGTTITNSQSSSSNPFTLSRLLPAGVLVIPLAANGTQDLCGHAHAEDGWHTFRGNVLLGHLQEKDDDSLVRQLDFLASNDYIRVTTFKSANRVFLRIYLVPFDLPDVQGRLRVRKEAVASPARRYLRSLLPKIVKDERIWNGRELDAFGEIKYFVDSTPDRRTLSEIYSDVPSPSVNTNKIGAQTSIINQLLDTMDSLDDLGLRSSLYSYQRRSVAALVEVESQKGTIPDPLYVAYTGMDGRHFYIQPGTLEILQECPSVAPNTGGILCEELGTGKTVMILSLILSDLHTISTPEESIVDPRPVLTPTALQLFPSPEMNTARNRFARRRGSALKTVPSLFELLLHHIRTETPSVLAELNESGHHHILELLSGNQPFYHHYPEESIDLHRSRRVSGNYSPGPRRIYLTSATLVVVPSNLLSQWYREIHKHTKDSLRVLLVGSKTQLPPVQELAAHYDLVLMSYDRLRGEGKKGSLDELHSWEHCNCPVVAGTRIPHCTCQSSSITPLLQIRWKRLVIDEGHVSGVSAEVTSFATTLCVQHRWIVTGTPTRNLLGLNFGSKAYEDDSVGDEMELEYPPSDPEESSSVSNTSSVASSPRIWNQNHDAEDLRRLGNMICSFISVPQFSGADGQKLMASCVRAPLMDRHGPRPGSIKVLENLMSMVMIRHRIQDIECDVMLPPLVHNPVFMDLDSYAATSYNALQASIAINAIDSERKDQDYLFHPRNAKFLQRTVQNMSQILFWSVDSDLYYNVDERVRTKDEYLAKADDRKYTEQDSKMLRDALGYSEAAAMDKCWRMMQTTPDIPIRVSQLSNEEVFRSWSRVTERSSSAEMFIQSSQLLKLRERVAKKPLEPVNKLCDYGRDMKDLEIRLENLYKESSKAKAAVPKSSNEADKHGISGTLQQDHVSKASALTRKTGSGRRTGRAKEMKAELSAAVERLKKLEEQDLLDDSNTSGAASLTATGGDGTLSSIVARSSISTMRLGRSASSKLNFIMDQVLKHSATEKFLIFSESELTLAFVADAMQLCNVKHLLFTSSTDQVTREQAVLTFETSDTYRVFLMALKHGSRGLNLVSASRVIFCEPVWQPDVESQAIKRVHRIGQTRPVTVQTLAIRNTAEEAMVNRRKALLERGGTGTELPKNFTDEKGMREFIANPTFLEPMANPESEIDIPLFKLPPGVEPCALPPPPTPVRPVKVTRWFPPTVTARPEGDTRLAIRIPSLTERSRVRVGVGGEKRRTITVAGPISGIDSDGGREGEGEPPRKKTRVVRFAV